MNSKIQLTSSIAPGLVLESIDSSDLEYLRIWKNANRQKFFRKTTITVRQQATWFAGYLSRPDDYMFMVKVDGCAIGCVGTRRDASGADVYNLIRGRRGGPRSAMRTAVKIIGTFSQMEFGGPVRAKVLESNYAAARWQQTCGASIVDVEENGGSRYYVLEFSPGSAVPLNVQTINQIAVSG